MSEIKCNQTKLEFANEDTDRFGGNFAGHSDQTKIAHSEWCRLQTYLQEIYSCREIFARIRILSRPVICKTVMQRSCSLQALLISEPVEQIENGNSPSYILKVKKSADSTFQSKKICGKNA